MPSESRQQSLLNSPWWRIPVWVALTFATVIAAHGIGPRILAGVSMGVGAVALQLADHHDLRLRRVAVLGATLGGLGACFAAPGGIAEILVGVAASRAIQAFDGTALRCFVVLDSVAFALTVGYISRSVAGLLVGVAIPLLVQRTLEHRELVRERDRAEALLAEVQAGREAETQSAALRERGRIAREMHDVLAHSLAGLSVQLQAVRAVAAREGVGPVVLEPLDTAAALARDGLAEARSAVGTLRDPVGLGLDALPALVQRHPGNVTLVVGGQPARLADLAGHAVYRAVQESLTNAARYAPGTTVRVELDWTAAALNVDVTDTGPAPGRTAVAGQGTGLGLAGMDERIREAHGSLRAGPVEGGGWRVHLEVPALGEVGK